MSRREYDFENGDTSLDVLMKAINTQKANFGGDSMYIELARKFDNSDYQWVIYRSTINSSNCWDILTSGYFVLFRLNDRGTSIATAEVVKSLAFSNLYLSQGISQCVISQTSMSGSEVSFYTYIHTLLFVPVSTTRYHTAYLRTYNVNIQTVTTTGQQYGSPSNVILANTSTTIGNYINNNPFIYSSGTSIQWNNSSNNNGQGSLMVRLTLSSSFALTPTISSSVSLPSTTQTTRCQLLYYNNFYAWITWQPDAGGNNVYSTMGLTTYPTATGWTKSTTYVEPFNTRYYRCYYFPIWKWVVPTSNSTTYINQNNMCLWWMTKEDNYNAYLERKFMMSSLTSLTPTSTSENQDYYKIGNGKTYSNYPSMFGLMTIDGRFIYTMNVNTRLLEKIDTKVR